MNVFLLLYISPPITLSMVLFYPFLLQLLAWIANVYAPVRDEGTQLDLLWDWMATKCNHIMHANDMQCRKKCWSIWAMCSEKGLRWSQMDIVSLEIESMVHKTPDKMCPTSCFMKIIKIPKWKPPFDDRLWMFRTKMRRLPEWQPG